MIPTTVGGMIMKAAVVVTIEAGAAKDTATGTVLIRRILSLDINASLWITRCGWRFHASNYERLRTIPPDASWQSNCERCMPEYWAQMRQDAFWLVPGQDRGC